jgi:transposase-like protein
MFSPQKHKRNQMTNQDYYSIFDEIVEDISGGGKDSLSKTISAIMNLAMRIEQEKAIQAGQYERSDHRLGQRNGYKSKTLKTRVGEISIQIPQGSWNGFLPRLNRKRGTERAGSETRNSSNVCPGRINLQSHENC